MSEDEYYALHQVAINTLDMEANEDEKVYCGGDDQPLYRTKNSKSTGMDLWMLTK